MNSLQANIRNINDELQRFEDEGGNLPFKAKIVFYLRSFSTFVTGRTTDSERIPWILTPFANLFFGCLIMLNAVYLGLETELGENSVQANVMKGEGVTWFVVDSVFQLLFTIELSLRIAAERIKAFKDPWNLFDLALVVTGAIDTWILTFVLSGTLSSEAGGGQGSTLAASIIPVVRILRILRLLRLLRLFRFLRELMLLAQGIYGAVKALSWSAAMIFLVLYISAVFTTRFIGKADEEAFYPEDRTSINNWFGSIWLSLLTLFQLMSLENWPQVVRTVMRNQGWTVAFFVPFLMLTNFVLLNLVTAVVVENVFAVAQREASFQAKKEEENRVKAMRRLKRLFETMDQDGNGTLDIEEFEQAMQDEQVCAQFLQLGIAKYEADDLFECLDVDGNQELSVAEFIDGCMRMQGVAKSKHLLQVQYDLHKAHRAIHEEMQDATEMTEMMEEHIEKIQATLETVKQRQEAPYFAGPGFGSNSRSRRGSTVADGRHHTVDAAQTANLAAQLQLQLQGGGGGSGGGGVPPNKNSGSVPVNALLVPGAADRPRSRRNSNEEMPMGHTASTIAVPRGDARSRGPSRGPSRRGSTTEEKPQPEEGGAPAPPPGNPPGAATHPVPPPVPPQAGEGDAAARAVRYRASISGNMPREDTGLAAVTALRRVEERMSQVLKLHQETTDTVRELKVEFPKLRDEIRKEQAERAAFIRELQVQEEVLDTWYGDMIPRFAGSLVAQRAKLEAADHDADEELIDKMLRDSQQ